MIRNIDVLQEMQNKVNKFNILTDELSVILDTEEIEMSDLIENGDSVIIDILNTINDVGKLLDLATFENEADGRKGYNIWINLSHLEDDGEIDHYCYLTLNVDELVTPKNAAYVNPVYCNFTDQLLQTGIAEDTGIRKTVDDITYHLWVFKQEFLEDLHDVKYHEYSKRYDECIDSMNLDSTETEEQGMNIN